VYPSYAVAPGGAGGSGGSIGDPTQKQAAQERIIRPDDDDPGLQGSGRNFGRNADPSDAIRVSIPRTTISSAEIADRMATEGRVERPVTAAPVSVDDAITVLKAAEAGWPAGDDAGYAALLADAHRLKLVQAALLRRPMTAEDQGVITAIAQKYGQYVNDAAAESNAAQRAIEVAERQRSNAIARGDLPAASRMQDRVNFRRDALAARFAPSSQGRDAARSAGAISRALAPQFATLAAAIGR
jgi:hypothetical protein